MNLAERIAEGIDEMIAERDKIIVERTSLRIYEDINAQIAEMKEGLPAYCKEFIKANAPTGGLERAMGVVSGAIQDMEDYRHSWHANLAMAYIDCGGDPVVANKAANTFLARTFEVGKSEAPPINGDELAERFGAEEASTEQAAEPSVEHRLLAYCRKFIDDKDITCGEAIYQCDHIAEVAQEFIECMCEIVGFKESSDDQ